MNEIPELLFLKFEKQDVESDTITGDDVPDLVDQEDGIVLRHPPHKPQVDREDDSSSADYKRELHLPRLQAYGLATTHPPKLQSEVSPPTTKLGQA